MRVLLAVLVVGIAGCGGDDNSPGDVAAPSSPAVAPVKAENAEAGPPKTKADNLPAQAAGADPVVTLEMLGAKINRDEQGEVVEVNFIDTQITDVGLVYLKGLTKLEVLSLTNTDVTDAGLVRLRGLTSLQTLILYHNQKITDAGLVHLKGLTSLQTLSFWNSKITDAGLLHLKGLTKLQGLHLARTKITDAGLVHLKGLTSLQTLGFSGTKITDAGIADLQKVLPNCKISK